MKKISTLFENSKYHEALLFAAGVFIVAIAVMLA